MKTKIHPQYHDKAQVVCSCGNMFTVGSTRENIHVELCFRCHPFYTGQQKFVDTASRIEKFQRKIQAVKPKVVKKKEEAQERQGPLTLREMLQSVKK